VICPEAGTERGCLLGKYSHSSRREKTIKVDETTSILGFYIDNIYTKSDCIDLIILNVSSTVGQL
jgi:hypothetical protein